MRPASTYCQLGSRGGRAQTHCPFFIAAGRILLRPLGRSLQNGVLIRSPALSSNDFDVNYDQQTLSAGAPRAKGRLGWRPRSLDVWARLYENAGSPGFAGYHRLTDRRRTGSRRNSCARSWSDVAGVIKLNRESIHLQMPGNRLQRQHQLDDDPDISENEYEAIYCPACTRIHLVNRKTAKPLGQDDEVRPPTPRTRTYKHGRVHYWGRWRGRQPCRPRDR